MSTTTVPARVGQVCKRYGPGLLPGSDRPAVGAGYAFTTAALSATVLFHVVTVATHLQVGMAYLQSSYAAGGLGYFGLLAVPFVIPTAFAGGVVAWRLVPERTPYTGVVVGLLATVLTYVFAALLVAVAMFASTLVEPQTFISVTGAVVVGAAFAGVGFLLTFWVTLPLGAVSGWIHERAVATEHSG